VMCRVYELYHGNNMEILPTLKAESIGGDAKWHGK